MLHPVFLAILRQVAACTFITACWIALWRVFPASTEYLADLIEHHFLAAGSLLVLTVIFIDAQLVAARNLIGQRNVGTKSSAQQYNNKRVP
jgi:hypothetical protein